MLQVGSDATFIGVVDVSFGPQGPYVSNVRIEDAKKYKPDEEVATAVELHKRVRTQTFPKAAGS